MNTLKRAVANTLVWMLFIPVILALLVWGIGFSAMEGLDKWAGGGSFKANFRKMLAALTKGFDDP